MDQGNMVEACTCRHFAFIGVGRMFEFESQSRVDLIRQFAPKSGIAVRPLICIQMFGVGVGAFLLRPYFGGIVLNAK